MRDVQVLDLVEQYHQAQYHEVRVQTVLQSSQDQQLVLVLDVVDELEEVDEGLEHLEGVIEGYEQLRSEVVSQADHLSDLEDGQVE